MTTTLSGSRNSTAEQAKPSPVATAMADTTANSVKVKAPRKARVKPDGLAINFIITDPAEIAALNKLAASDRRTPENYVSLIVYKALTGHIASSAAEEGAGVK